MKLALFFCLEDSATWTNVKSYRVHIADQNKRKWFQIGTGIKMSSQAGPGDYFLWCRVTSGNSRLRSRSNSWVCTLLEGGYDKRQFPIRMHAACPEVATIWRPCKTFYEQNASRNEHCRYLENIAESSQQLRAQYSTFAYVLQAFPPSKTQRGNLKEEDLLS